MQKISLKLWCTQHFLLSSFARNLMYVHCLHNDNEKCHKSIGRIWYRSVEYWTHTYIAISSLHFMQMGFISNRFMPHRNAMSIYEFFHKIANTHSRRISMEKFFIFFYLSKNLLPKDLNCFSIKSRENFFLQPLHVGNLFRGNFLSAKFWIRL